ncbi:MAG: hypothetical protein C0418_01625 [Coriobacteriaceae bacterium]|nr:hypothetical protein [Coriobacteriaceae bacterium]
MSPPTAPALRVVGARKQYESMLGKPKTAVADVSLEVYPGEVLGLLGPNGAGKTTTLKMLLGIVRPSGGEFEILGRPARGPGARARLGFLPEQPYFPQHVTAAEALRLYGRLLGMDRRRIISRSREMLEEVGLGAEARTQLSKFSRGMLQRLGLAQALLGEPEVLILDEPASGLDPIGQRDVRNTVLKMRSAGTAVLLSSHQLSEVEAVCDRVTILSRGEVAASGDIGDLLNAAGRTSVRARGVGEALPETLAALAEDIAFSGGVWMFAVRDEDVRRALEMVWECGGSVVAVEPKRESLEDYFSVMLARGGVDPDAA